MFDLSELFSSFYYLDRSPGGDFLIGFLLLAYFIFVIFLGPMFSKISRGNRYLKKSVRRRMWPFPFLGGSGIFLVMARFSKVPFFSMRLFLYIVLLFSLIVGGYTFFVVYRDYRLRISSVEREKNRRIQ